MLKVSRMRQALPSFVLGVGVALVVCTALSWSGGGFSLFTVVIIQDASDVENDVVGTNIPVNVTEMPTDVLTKDAMFTGGATILGLVVFGSLLNVLISLNSRPVYEKRAIVWLAFGVAAGAIGSLFLMISACCIPFVDIGLYISIVLISGSVIITILWVAHAFDELLKHQRRDPPTDSQ